jgi:hypothetical protein
MARRDLTLCHGVEVRSFPHGDADLRYASGVGVQLRPRIRGSSARARPVDESSGFDAKRVSRLLYDYPVSLRGKNSPVAMIEVAPRTRARCVAQHRALEDT